MSRKKRSLKQRYNGILWSKGRGQTSISTATDTWIYVFYNGTVNSSSIWYEYSVKAILRIQSKLAGCVSYTEYGHLWEHQTSLYFCTHLLPSKERFLVFSCFKDSSTVATALHLFLVRTGNRPVRKSCYGYLLPTGYSGTVALTCWL